MYVCSYQEKLVCHTVFAYRRRSMKNKDDNWVRINPRTPKYVSFRGNGRHPAEVVLQFRGWLHKSFMKSTWNLCRISTEFIRCCEVSCGRPGSIQVQVDLNSVLLLPERMKIITYTYINSYVPAFFFLRVMFLLLPNQVHMGHDLVHVFCAVYLGPQDMTFSTPCITWKSKVQAFQWLRSTW